MPLDLLLPPAWRRELAGCRLERAAMGETAALVYRLRRRGGEDEFIKAATGTDAEELRHEWARLTWLAQKGVIVPRLLDVHDDGQSVALRMTALPGAPAETMTRKPKQTTIAVGRALATLHAIPVDDCPFHQQVDIRLAAARERVERGLVDVDDFDLERRGRTAASLLEELVQLRPKSEDVVVTHGDASLANLIIDKDRVGFVDCHRAGRADRHVDLAILAREVAGTFGARWLPVLFAAYGMTSPDTATMEFFRLLDELF